MDPERWQKIDHLLDAVFALAPEDRGKFLDEACEGDPKLRSEIEKLLASDERDSSSIQAPVRQAAAELFKSATFRLSSGYLLGPYKIISLLGSGGMGDVYLAQDMRLKRKVAIKLLHLGLSTNADLRIRFEREARAVSSLSHPNICSIYDLGHYEEFEFLVMEHIDGKNLDEVIQGKALPVKILLELAIGIAAGVSAAHHAGIVHRDLKPANIMVTNDGRIKILDFGLAKFRTPLLDDEASVSKSITRTGMVYGTISYMSPEQAAGKPLDFPSDQFSFGLLLYEMATGNKAFDRGSAPQTLAAIIEDDPLPVSVVNPKTPPPLAWIIQRCIAKDPNQRFDSTLDLYRQLCDFRDHLSESVSQVAFTNPKQTPRKAIVALILLSLSLVLAAFLFNKGKSQLLSYDRITFRRGYISSARFVPGNQTIIYRGAFANEGAELFMTEPHGATSRSLGIQNADILSISPTGQMAILLHEREFWFVGGLLAEVPRTGGTPREIADDVWGACWAPDGSKLAVVRRLSGKSRIEFPLGNVLYESASFIRELRFSPDGKWISFNEHPWLTTIGSVIIMDLKGKKVATSNDIAPEGTAWFNSDEVWITSFDSAKYSGSELYALNTSGEQQLIQRFPPRATIHDISDSGQLLLSFEEVRSVAVVIGEDQEQLRDLSWRDYSLVTDISADGQNVLLHELEEGGEELQGTIYVRNVDGSPPIRLGNGYPRNFSRDGKSVLISQPRASRFVLMPVGIGETKSFNVEPFRSDSTFRPGTGATLSPDGKWILFLGKEPGGLTRPYLQNVYGGKPRPIAPEGMQYVPQTISPDGKSFVAVNQDGQMFIHRIDGTDSYRIQGIAKDEEPLQWNREGTEIYISKQNPMPIEIFRLNPRTGKRVLVKKWTPSDLAGVWTASNVRLTPDEKYFAFSYTIDLVTLYVISGVK